MKQNYGVFHKTATVVNGRLYDGAIFTSKDRSDCEVWAKGQKYLTVRKLNAEEMKKYNE